MTSRSPRLRLVVCLWVAAVGLHGQTNPGPPLLSPIPGPRNRGAPKPNDDEIIPKFELSGADIDAVLGALETYTGRAVIRPGTLPVAPGGYTLRLSHLPKSEVVLALETLLSLNQVGVVPLGDRFLKVVPLSVARAEAPLFITGSTLSYPPSGRVATKLFQLDFLRVGELFNSNLNTMFTPGIGGGVVVLEKANAALVTDTISNLQRLEMLIDSVDKPVSKSFTPKFYPLSHAKASDMVTKIHALLTGPLQNQIGTATNYNADDRTNQVIVISDPREIPFFDGLIEKLDIPADPNTHNEVIYLKHADAKDVTTLLSALVSGQNAATQKAAGQSVRPGEIATPGQPAPGAPANPTLQNAMQGLGIGTNQFSSLMTIQPDERSNAVVVSGTLDDIRLIRELIVKLDIALAQVRIQMIIAEVTLSDTDISGVSSLGLTVGQNSAGSTKVLNWAGGGTNSATPQTSIAGWDFTNGVVNPLAFNAALNAASTGSRSLIHVLQAPTIVTAHNKPGEVTVGQQVPIINGGQSTLAGVGTSPVQSFNSTYQNIAIDLTVTPLIGDNGDIQLTVDQKVDDIGSYITIQAGDTQPVINHRELKSFLTVKDGQMIVLGGLQETQKTATQNKLGFLYEIPIISQLLGGHTDDLERTELLLFIRPLILPPEDGSADTRRRVAEMSNRDQINQFLQNPAPQPESKVKNFLDRFKSD
jgi:general secretion pathway protein D